jgi:uncharacterized protein
MLTSLKFVAALLIGGYLLICALLYASQRAMIYHPQPRGQQSTPVMDVMSDGLVLKVSTLPKASQQAVIYFGGNAEDVSSSLPQLAQAFPDAALYALHYRGFGGSQGQPSEQALYADALALHARVAQQHSQIILIGRSLGSGVATYLGSQRPVQRLVLITPYSSIADVAAAQFAWFPVRWLLKDHFDSMRYVAQSRVPVLIVAAQRDEVIPAWSAQRLFDAAPATLRRMTVIEGVGHNDISLHPDYLRLLAKP